MAGDLDGGSPYVTVHSLRRNQPGRRVGVALGCHERHLDLGGFLVGLEKVLNRLLKLDGKIGEGD